MSSREVIPHTKLEAALSVADEIRRAIGYLSRPDDVGEVRVPKAGRNRTISGYFSDSERMAQEVEGLEALHFPGVYRTLNPVNPALLARADNKLKKYVEYATSDADIVCRRWLIADFDPKRPAGISSSDAEHAAALELARRMRDALAGEGWPEPIFADSGNGAHLLYPIELPNDPEATDLVKRCLRALAARFNTDLVAVDEGMYNASRICKVYGTTARKGDNTEDRPHRVSRILEAPSSLIPVPIELLNQLAAQAPERSGGRVVEMPQKPERGSVRCGTVPYPARCEIPSPIAHKGGRKFVLEECPGDPSHRHLMPRYSKAPTGSSAFTAFTIAARAVGGANSAACWNPSIPARFLRSSPRPALSPPLRESRTPDSSSSGDGQPPGGHGSARVEDNAASMFQRLAPYPAPLGEDAYYGIAERFVRLVEPHTEADPSFMLVQFLICTGNIFGRNAFVWAGADQHYPNLFGCGVGPTAAGRKGSASGPVQLFFKGIDEDWVRSIQSGLSSGEGLIWCVRDPIYRREKVSQGKGKPAEYEEVLVDPGVDDKRLLVHESEFFGALQAMRRQGNTLSPVMRSAFDKGNLNSMVKNSPAKATGAHISIVGNITKEELLRAMLVDEMDNGFANRFLWACSRRSKCLPKAAGCGKSSRVSRSVNCRRTSTGSTMP